MPNSALLLLCVKCRHEDSICSFPGSQHPGDAAIRAGPFGRAGQIIAKAVSPAGTKVHQGGPAWTKVFSARMETHRRGKRNKAKLMAHVLQITALFAHWDGAEMSESKQHPWCFTSAGEATPGPPTTLGNDVVRSPPAPLVPPHPSQPLPSGMSSTASPSSSRDSPPLCPAISRASDPTPRVGTGPCTRGRRPRGRCQRGTTLSSDG